MAAQMDNGGMTERPHLLLPEETCPSCFEAPQSINSLSRLCSCCILLATESPAAVEAAFGSAEPSGKGLGAAAQADNLCLSEGEERELLCRYGCWSPHPWSFHLPFDWNSLEISASSATLLRPLADLTKQVRSGCIGLNRWTGVQSCRD